MLRILFIEDEDDAIKPILDMIEEAELDIEHYEFGFDEAEGKVKLLRPDIVVLDLWEGDASENENRGSEYLDFIWNQQFCPVIIHSAQPDIPEEQKNSFVKEVTKGQNSPQSVFNAIHDFRPHVEALNGAEEHIRNSLSIAMRDVVPSTFDVFIDVGQRNDAIRRASRRRLAALMDEIPVDGQNLASWEQYICPPVSRDALLGDILRETDGDSRNPANFRVVLTPSCDLISSGGRQPKVNNVLVARCCSMAKGLSLTSLGNLSAAKLKDRLIGTVLSRGYYETILPFPALQGRIPTMVANFQDLEHILLGDIGLKDKRFLRVASLDSPFRELVSWAYVQVAGRPGVPDRDFAAWRDEIMKIHKGQPK